MMPQGEIEPRWEVKIPSTRAGAVARKTQRNIALAVVLLPFLGFLITVWLAWGKGVAYREVGLLICLYVASVIGVEVGFHRHFAHHAFKTGPRLRALLAVLGSMAAQGPVLYWVAIHRRHHAHSDRPGDPHSPHVRRGEPVGLLAGLWHAHIGWLFADELTDWSNYAPDLLRDRTILRIHFLYPYWVLLGLLFPAMVWGALSWTWAGCFNGFLWGGLMRIFLVNHSTWSVNSLCHMVGRRAFNSRDRSTNNLWLAVISLGGSWHNNHHAFPTSARTGIRWWQIDPSGWFIGALQAAGLVWDVKAPSPTRGKG